MKKPDNKTLTTQVITDSVLGSFLNYMPNPDDIGRVEPGSYLPGAPTDPDVPNFRTAGPRHPVPLE